MTTYHTFTGICAYPHVLSLNKYKKHSVNFYPDAETRKEIKSLGLRAGLKEDDGEKSGVPGFYYVFTYNPARSFGKPLIVEDAAGGPWPKDKLIGNGSKIEVDIEVYEGNHPEYGKYKGHRMKRVRILEHIPYVPKQEAQQEQAMPVEEEKYVEAAQPVNPGKKKRPF